MSSHDIGAGTASAKASSGSASDLPPPSERGELIAELKMRLVMATANMTLATVPKDTLGKVVGALLSAEAQITRLEGERDTAVMLYRSIVEKRDSIARDLEDARGELEGAPTDRISSRVWFTRDGDRLRPHFSFMKSYTADRVIEVVRKMRDALSRNLGEVANCPLHTSAEDRAEAAEAKSARLSALLVEARAALMLARPWLREGPEKVYNVVRDLLTRLSKTGGEGIDLQTNVEPQCADPQAGRASGAGVSGEGGEA